MNLSRQTLAHGARLVVWPESATPFFFEMDSAFAAPIRRLAAESRTPFIIGTDEYARVADAGHPAGTSYNSAVLVGADGRTDATYRKMHLVPFGEYVPLKRLLFFIGPFVHAVSDFGAGTTPTVFDVGAAGGEGRVSVAICYESIYPGISRTFVTRGSELLAVITNDSWFGPSSAPYQHFNEGVLRAVEEGRFVRSFGEHRESAAPWTLTDGCWPSRRCSSRRRWTRTCGCSTVRTIYSRIGDVVAWLSAVLTALFVALFVVRGLVKRRRDRRRVRLWPDRTPLRRDRCRVRLQPDRTRAAVRCLEAHVAWVMQKYDFRRTSPLVRGSGRACARPAEGALTKPACSRN